MYEWCAYEGLTTYRIAKRLTEMGVLTLSDKDGVRKKKLKGVGIWHRDTVHGILTNTTYKGEWFYRKSEVKRIDTSDGVKMKVRKRDESERILIHVPAIVSSELWELAQKRLQANAKRNFKQIRHQYLLRGRIRCAMCGGAMVGWTRVYEGKKKTTVNSWYRCAKKYQFGVNSPNSCQARNLRGPRVEDEVWNCLVNLVLDEKMLFGKIEVQQKEKKNARKFLEHSIAKLETKNQADKAGLDKLLDLYLIDEVAKDRYLARKKQIKQIMALYGFQGDKILTKGSV